MMEFPGNDDPCTMSTWKYIQNGQTCGPVDTSALHALLKNGTLPPETQVWTQGMPNWVAARTLPEFGKAPAPGAPASPLPSGPGASPLSAQTLPPVAGDMDPADIEKNKIFAVLAYVGLLFLVPLLAAPQSKFARYHTNQGVVLFLATLVLSAASFILTLIPVIGCVAMFVPMGIFVGALILMILGIINAASGQCKPLPIIGHYQLIK
jgi:uncharacterized membrane protein